jgi:DNA-binding PadR family transcriptional regulator
MTHRERPGEFETLVLLSVARLEGDGYGVTIRRELEERAGRTAVLGAVYATLERLERKGLVVSRQGEASPVRGGRARRHYRLTAEGARTLRETQRALTRLWDGLELRPSPRGAR